MPRPADDAPPYGTPAWGRWFADTAACDFCGRPCRARRPDTIGGQPGVACTACTLVSMGLKPQPDDELADLLSCMRFWHGGLGRSERHLRFGPSMHTGARADLLRLWHAAEHLLAVHIETDPNDHRGRTAASEDARVGATNAYVHQYFARAGMRDGSVGHTVVRWNPGSAGAVRIARMLAVCRLVYELISTPRLDDFVFTHYLFYSPACPRLSRAFPYRLHAWAAPARALVRMGPDVQWY